MEELLSLKWNNHRSTFLHILAVLRDKQLYTDATLACDGKLYSVHKLVLSTCSDYFSSMLDRTSCKNPVIVLKDIKSEDLEALLDYMYLGEVNVRQSDLATLIKAAECLRVKGLAVPDDEPPPRKTRANENQTRRGDTSGSPPAKRKRRSDVDDGRDDVRPVRQEPRQEPRHEPRQSSPIHNSSLVRPKSPLSNSHHTPTSNNSNNNRVSPSVNNSASSSAGTFSNNVNSNSVAPRDPDHNMSPAATDSTEPTPCVKVEMIEDDTPVPGDGDDSNTGGGGDGMNDSYNAEDFKEEDDPGDLGADLPEFLQQATGNYPHSSFPGTSFQPDLSWQGGDGNGGGMAGTFAAAGLSFGGEGGQNTSTGIAGSGREHYCPTCGKLFNGRNWKQNLEYHMFKHTGLKPFRCPICEHSSALKFNLLRHIKNKHPDILSPPVMSDENYSATLTDQLQDQLPLLAISSQFTSSNNTVANASTSVVGVSFQQHELPAARESTASASSLGTSLVPGQYCALSSSLLDQITSGGNLSLPSSVAQYSSSNAQIRTSYENASALPETIVHSNTKNMSNFDEISPLKKLNVESASSQQP